MNLGAVVQSDGLMSLKDMSCRARAGGADRRQKREAFCDADWCPESSLCAIERSHKITLQPNEEVLKQG